MASGLDIPLIEDNLSLGKDIAEYLERRGHRLDLAYGGQADLRRPLEGLRWDHARVELPRLDGLALRRRLRASSQT